MRLDLQPGLRAPGAIGRVRELANDAFQPQARGVLQHEVAAVGEVLAVLENAVRRVREQGSQGGLAIEQRAGAGVLAVQMQQIEEIVAEPVAAALAQVRLQGAEIRHAVVGLDHHLAVQECAHDRQGGERLGHIGELGRPVEPAAGQQLDAAVIEAGQQPIAVEFHLVHPAVAGRRLLDQACQRRLDEARQRRRLGTFHLELGARRGRISSLPATSSGSFLATCG